VSDRIKQDRRGAGSVVARRTHVRLPVRPLARPTNHGGSLRNALPRRCGAGESSENFGPNFGPLTPKHDRKRGNTWHQRASRYSSMNNQTKSAKPPSPVQIRAAPPNFLNSLVRFSPCQRGGEKHPKPIKAFTKAWKTACAAAGCPGRIPHDFRRTAVQNLVRSGVPERVAMQMTGHRPALCSSATTSSVTPICLERRREDHERRLQKPLPHGSTPDLQAASAGAGQVSR
jgi:hypothetical protein